jgi:hypothetical protein
MDGAATGLRAREAGIMFRVTAAATAADMRGMAFAVAQCAAARCGAVRCAAAADML